MKISDNVKIGGFVYDIDRPPDAFPSQDGRLLDGEHCFCDKKIKVAHRGCTEYQQMVLLHEICHAIIDCYTSEEQNEAFVEQFSKGLYQVIIDNPDIFGGKDNE